MIERENTRPTLVVCCAWFDCFLSMLLVFFPASFSYSACVAGLVLPACVSVQPGSPFSSLLYSFLAKRTKLSSFFSKKTPRTPFACSSLAFLLGVGNHCGVFAATSGAGLWPGTLLVRLHGGTFLFGNNPMTFLAANLLAHLASRL